MTLSIRTKLFLTLLTATALVVVGMLVFTRWSFERGLVELAQARQQEHIEQIGERLIELYRREGGWERLRADKRLWVGILSGRGEGFGPGRLGERGAMGPRWLRHALEEPGLWPPERVLQARALDGRPRPVPLRLMLLDADGTLLYGRPELLAGTERFPLEVDGRLIGELALLPGPLISELGEIRFQERQTSDLVWIALAMILLCGALAFPLARRLVRPLQGFQAVARRLASGELSARVGTRGTDELGRLGQDLDALGEALERHEQARRRWIADISHELRTPLGVLRAELEALQDGVRPLDRTAVDSLHADVLRLGRLVDDLYQLSMSDLGALSYHKADTDLAERLEADLDAFRAQFVAAGLSLAFENRLDGSAILAVDEQRLSQLFRNLLRNSLQYTGPGGGLRVSLQRQGRLVVVDFQDTAPSVPPEALPRLFEPLYRGEGSRSRVTGGAGLGLAIARNIAEAHGGTLEARPSPLGGLWVRLSLP
jgi:two-component system sensor histidine kinase BaeS